MNNQNLNTLIIKPEDKADLLNEYFISQTEVNIKQEEVRDVLESLDER